MVRLDSAGQDKVLALYRRVSTNRQAEEGYSLEVQREKLEAYAKVLSAVRQARTYTDDGYSGASLDRPGIRQLIEDVRAGRITHVVVVKLDRLSRSQKDTLYLIEDVFIPNHVAFISIQESFDTSTAYGRAMVGLLSVFAQLERENIFERTRGGMLKRVEAGKWPGGGRTPFGYDYDARLDTLVPNADAGKVRYIYDRYLDGEAMQTLADELGLKYERVVYNILTRKANAGYIVYNGVEYKGLHEPIVSLETYERAMDLLRARSAGRLVSRTEHLLTGMVYCGVCGAKMRYLKWGKAGYKLVCYSQQKSKPYLIRDPNCDNPMPWARDVEAGVVQALFAAAGTLPNARKAVEAATVTHVLAGQLNRAQAKLRRLYGLYGDGADEALLETIRTVKEEAERLRTCLADEDAKARAQRQVRRSREKLEGIRDAWEEMTVRERRAVLASVIERVTVLGECTDVTLKFGLGQAGEEARD